MQMDIHLMPDLMQCVENSDVVFAASGMDICQPLLEVAAVVQICNLRQSAASEAWQHQVAASDLGGQQQWMKCRRFGFGVPVDVYCLLFARRR